MYAALTASLRRPYQLFVNENLAPQQEVEDSSSTSPEGYVEEGERRGRGRLGREEEHKYKNDNLFY